MWEVGAESWPPCRRGCEERTHHPLTRSPTLSPCLESFLHIYITVMQLPDCLVIGTLAHIRVSSSQQGLTTNVYDIQCQFNAGTMVVKWHRGVSIWHLKVTKLMTVATAVTLLPQKCLCCVDEFFQQDFTVNFSFLSYKILHAGVLNYSSIDGGSVLKRCIFIQLDWYAFNGTGNRSIQGGLTNIFLWGNSANRYATTLHSLQLRESA